MNFGMQHEPLCNLWELRVSVVMMPAEPLTTETQRTLRMHREIISGVLILATLLISGCEAPRVVTVDSKDAPLNVETSRSKQTAHQFEKTDYLLYLPAGYSKDDKRWPLI